jgi:large subunit ribosomal protein L25
MAEQNTIKALLRDRAGTGGARALRREGRLPAVIYGAKQDPLPISLDTRDVNKGLVGGSFFSTVFVIDIGAGEAERVLPRDVQFHPVTDRPEHVDFLRVTGETKINVEVPVVFLNEDLSPGLKRGGVLNVVRHTIEVICAVSIIPDRFEIDLTGTDIGDSIHVGSIALPDGVESAITDRDFTIATVSAPTVMEEPEVEDEELEGVEGEAGKTPDEEAGDQTEPID